MQIRGPGINGVDIQAQFGPIDLTSGGPTEIVSGGQCFIQSSGANVFVQANTNISNVAPTISSQVTGIYSIAPGATSSSYADISTTNKSAVQYATDVDAIVSAVPNIQVLNNRIAALPTSTPFQQAFVRKGGDTAGTISGGGDLVLGRTDNGVTRILQNNTTVANFSPSTVTLGGAGVVTTSIVRNGATLVTTGADTIDCIPASSNFILRSAPAGKNMIVASAGNISGTSGFLLLTSGSATGGGSSSGECVVQSGDASATGNTAPMRVRSGTCINSTSPSGLVQVKSGDAGVFSGTLSLETGSLGQGASTSGSAGNIEITCGSTQTYLGANARNGGSILVRPSLAKNGGTDGNVQIYAGTLTGNRIEYTSNGRLASALSNYETLVTSDGVLTNKKYVDNAVIAGITGASLNSLSDVTITGTPLTWSRLLYDTGSSQWVNRASSKALAFWDGNATVSGSGLDNYNIAGTFNVSQIANGFIIGGFGNLFLLSNGVTGAQNYKVQFTSTASPTSVNRNLTYRAYKNPDNPVINPSAGYIPGSRVQEVVSNSTNTTTTVSNSFFVSLVSSDAINFFVQNSDASQDLTIVDFRVSIEALD